MTKSGNYCALERGEGTPEFVEVPSSSSSVNRKGFNRNVIAGIIMAVAVVALLALALQNDGSVVPARHSLAQSKVRSQKLDDDAPAEDAAAPEANGDAADDAFVPNMDKIHFPNTWAAFQKTFGAHLTWAIIVLVCATLTWIYVRFIRPKSWFKDLMKKATESTKLPINVADTLGNVPTEVDANDIVSSITLVPGEAVFFSEEAATKSVGTVYKLSVTNHRLIAQRAETTLCGTCQVGAREDCWPIENVSKISVITGEFNGHTVSGLIHYCWAYFGITMGFDLLQAFVLENIEDFLGSFASRFPELITIVDASISVLCNVLFFIAIIYAFAAMSLVIWPQSLVKVFLKREMEEVGPPSGCCCGVPNSQPMETFTFKTEDSYRAYQAIMAARSGAGTGKALVGGAYNQIPPSVYHKATSPQAMVSESTDLVGAVEAPATTSTTDAKA